MYSSLHKVDIVASDKADPNRKLFVQTDHRTPEEIDAEPELTVIFGLARMLLPRRLPEAEGAVVRYVALAGAHPLVVELVAATGATLEAAGVETSLEGVAKKKPEELADRAFEGLGTKLLKEHGLSADERGLEAFERHAAGAPTLEEDEIGYWTAVVALAAVTGEVLRAKYGGRWALDPKDYADVPFMFEPGVEAGLVNPVGKAVKFLRYGDAESPRQLIKLVDDHVVPQGPLLFTFKPSQWGGRGDTLSEPIAPDLEKSGGDVPILVYGYDRPNTFAIMTKGGAEEARRGELRAEALANLVKVDVAVELVRLEGGFTFWVAQGYYACEKVLDVAFMKALHERIGSPLLAVAMPVKGQLLVTDAVSNANVIGGFMAIATGQYDKNEAGRQLTPTVFLVSDGVITGFAKATSEAPKKSAEQKKGFFKRLFS